MYEAYFFKEISIKSDIRCTIISFNTEASKYLKENNVNHFDIFEIGKKNKQDKKNKSFNEKYLTNRIFHEKMEFNLKDNNYLFSKYSNYYKAIGLIINELKKNYRLIIFQEVGGFISHLSLYDFAIKNKIEHYFLEPSFFNSRFMMLKNSHLIPKFKIKNNINKQVIKLINSLKKKKTISHISIHKKRYRSIFIKILDLNNLFRFFSKLFKKYILRYNFDYEYIFSYTYIHLKMALIRSRLNFQYVNKLEKPFVYFPLHVPNDISLTLRAKSFYNQFKLIDKILKYIPKNYKLIVKEHPSFIGRYDFKEILERNKNDQFILINPKTNSYDLIKKSSLIITINSKSGFEAILQNKKIMSFANSFYETFQKKDKIENIKNLEKIIKKKNDNTLKVLRYTSSFWNFTYEGELFNLKKSNIKNFVKFFENFS